MKSDAIIYLPKLDQVLDYFFNKVMLPGDSLKVYTPVKAYSIKEEAFKVLPKQKIADQLKVKLRKDIVSGGHGKLLSGLLHA